MPRKLPIGIQSFEGLRRDGYVYVDKTAYVYRLVHEGKPYFLSRPRRFGKSLLLSTLRAYFEGRRELFEGLAIEELEGTGPDAWQRRPVFYISFNAGDYTREGALDAVLDTFLRDWEDGWAASRRDGTAAEALAQIEEEGHATPFSADPRRLHLVGAAFDSTTRRLKGWEER